MPSIFSKPINTSSGGGSMGGGTTGTVTTSTPVQRSPGGSVFSSPLTTSNPKPIPAYKPVSTQPTQQAKPQAKPQVQSAPQKNNSIVPEWLQSGLSNFGSAVKGGLQEGAQIAGNFIDNTFKETKKQVSNLFGDPLNLKADPKKAIGDALNAIKDPLIKEKDNIANLFNSGEPASKKIGEGLQTIAGAGGVVFSPISALFSGANDIPVLGSVSKLATLPFTAAGETGTAVSDKVVDALPISDQAKKNIKPGMEEIFALAAQLALGKVAPGPEKIMELTKKFGEKDAQTIVSKATELAKEKRTNAGEYTPQEIRQEVLHSDLKETPAGQELLKSTFQAEKTDRNIRISTPEEGATNVLETPSGTKFTYNLIKPGEQLKNATPLDTAKFGQEGAKPQEGIGTEQSINDAVKGVSKVGKSVEAKAIEAKLTKGFEDTANYDKIQVKDQAERAAKVFENVDEAKQMIRGEKPLPEGLNGASLILAAEEHIKNTGDATLAHELANSPLVTETSQAGQTLRLLAEREPDSFTAKLMEIKKAKEEAFRQKFGKKSSKEVAKKLVDDARATIKKPSKYDWNDFVNSIQC